MSQLIDQAKSGKIVEAIFDIQVRDVEDANSIILEIERGGLGGAWVELYRLSGDEWVMVKSFSWSGHSKDNRNSSRFIVAKKTFFGDTK